MATNEELVKEVAQATEKLREIHAAKGAESAEFKNIAEKTDGLLAKFDDLNNRFVEQAAIVAKQEEKNKDLEAKLALGFSSVKVSTSLDASDYAKFVAAYIGNSWHEYVSEHKDTAEMILKSYQGKFDLTNQKDAQAFAHGLSQKSSDMMRSDLANYGGFLCPLEVEYTLNKAIQEIGPLRALATVQSTTRQGKEYFNIGPDVAAVWEGEAEATAEATTKKITKQVIQVKRMTAFFKMTQDLIFFEATNLMSEMLGGFATQFELAEVKAFMSGDYNKIGIRGWTQTKEVPRMDTAAAGTVTFDDVIKLTGELKKGYNPILMFNRKTLTYLRLLKDTQGRYYWSLNDQPASGPLATINGYGYNSNFIEFDDIKTGATPILFADMKKFYTIVDRTGIALIRDNLTEAGANIIKVYAHKYCGGAVEQPEAGVALHVK